MTKQASEFKSNARSNKNIIPLQHIMLKNTKTILFAAMSYFQHHCMLTIHVLSWTFRIAIAGTDGLW